jgi:hypothetical protein
MRGRKTTCSRCDKPKERIDRAHCRACHATRMRQWRKRHPLTEEQRRRKNARTYAFSYWKRGKLRQKPCRHCGESKTERHHPDYARPLYVIWLCRPCHLTLHANKRRRARHHVKQQRKARRRR